MTICSLTVFHEWAIQVLFHWVLWSRVSHEAAVKESASVAILSEDLTEGGSASGTSHVVLCEIPFLMGYWTEALSFSPALGQRPLSVPCHVDLSPHRAAHHIAAGFPWSKWVREVAQDGSHRLSPSLRSNMPPPLPIVFIINELLNPGHFQGEGIT